MSPPPRRTTHFPAVRKSTFLTDFSLQQSKENRRQVAVLVRHCLGGQRREGREIAPPPSPEQTGLSLPFGRFSVGGLFCRRRRFRIKPPRVKRWAVEVTQGGDGHGNASERRSGSAMPSATRAPAFRHLRLFLTLGGSTKSQLHHAAATGGPKKQNETEAININPHPDGRTDCSHVGQQRGEERGHMSTRRREFCSERRAEEWGVKVVYGIDETESLVCFHPSVPTRS